MTRVERPGVPAASQNEANVKLNAAAESDVHGFSLDPNKSVGHLLREALRAMVRELETRIDPYDITVGQFFIMRELWVADGLTQRELSGRMSLFENSTTAALAEMEKRGFIERRRSDEDRRKIHVFLSAKGKRIRKALIEHAVAVHRIGLAGLSENQIDSLRDTLRLIRRNMRTDANATRP